MTSPAMYSGSSNWFERLTGIQEKSPDYVRENLDLIDGYLVSKANGRKWKPGRLEMPTLRELRQRTAEIKPPESATLLGEVVADAVSLHCDEANQGALFQVASQFNLLEMVHPDVTPEDGIGGYEHDYTQGPACAIAAGAGTIYRNYLVPLGGSNGQSGSNQIDCLADIGERLGNRENQLWEVKNGYVIASKSGLERVSSLISEMNDSDLDEIRALLRVGIQWRTQVTSLDRMQLVSQVYCSALPVGYSALSPDLWEPFARLVLEATYEATVCAAIENQARNGHSGLFLTLVGGGAFGNQSSWILDAISRAISLYGDSGLDIGIVSHRESKPVILNLIDSFNKT